jgi:hypothetical protein
MQRLNPDVVGLSGRIASMAFWGCRRYGEPEAVLRRTQVLSLRMPSSI